MLDFDCGGDGDGSGGQASAQAEIGDDDGFENQSQRKPRIVAEEPGGRA